MWTFLPKWVLCVCVCCVWWMEEVLDEEELGLGL